MKKSTKIILAVIILVVAVLASLYHRSTPADEAEENTVSIEETISDKPLEPMHVPEGWEVYSNDEWGMAFAYPTEFALREVSSPINSEYTQNILLESDKYNLLIGKGDRGLAAGSKVAPSKYSIDKLLVQTWEREVNGKYEDTIRIESQSSSRSILITTKYDVEHALVQQFLSTLTLK